MGKYDKFLAGLSSGPAQGDDPPATGKYDQYLSGMDESPKTGELGFMDAVSIASEVAPSPTERIKRGLDKAGEKIAEVGGRLGYPKTASVAGTAVSELPAIAGSAATLSGLYGNTPLAQGIRNTPRMLSQRYDAVNQSAGISKDLPIRLGNIPKFKDEVGSLTKVFPLEPKIAPSVYPKDTNTFLNFARARLEGLGERLSPQELNDYKSMINTAIREGKIAKGTDQFAIATRLVKEKINPFLTKVVEGRGELDQIYAISKRLRVAPEVAKKIWDYVGPKMRWGAGVIGVP